MYLLSVDQFNSVPFCPPPPPPKKPYWPEAFEPFQKLFFIIIYIFDIFYVAQITPSSIMCFKGISEFGKWI